MNLGIPCPHAPRFTVTFISCESMSGTPTISIRNRSQRRVSGTGQHQHEKAWDGEHKVVNKNSTIRFETLEERVERYTDDKDRNRGSIAKDG